ncbi:MAG: LysM peptidoglycan-binding domain-containing protein [Bacteroidetes bacterium]|nr:LysM peptidoglycan-binding domain-containing protein [Bacteroidota bacterium]
MDQKLVKLKIEAYKDAKCVADKKGEIEAFINPSTYKETFKGVYKQSEEVGSNAPTMVFQHVGSSDLKLSFFVDGTGVVSLGKYSGVDAYIDAFKSVVCDFKGDMHSLPYLLVTWGRLSFTGVCSSVDVTYTMFTPEGKALRATLDVVITESVDFATKAKEAAKSSPDLTHFRTVKAGDTLPLLTYQIYGSSAHYVEVAKYNGLSSFNAIKPGDALYFPPIPKKLTDAR